MKAASVVLYLLSTQVIAAPVHKLREMYQVFYLPFFFEFKEVGKEVEPYQIGDRGEPRTINSVDLEKKIKQWDEVRKGWKRRSLILTAQPEVNTSQKLTQKIFLHRIALSKGPFDGLPLIERTRADEVLKKLSPEQQAVFNQTLFLKNFLTGGQVSKFNLFVFAPQWCASSKEYILLLEEYSKRLSGMDWLLHVVFIEDPNRQFFGSKLKKLLLPHPEKYSHETTPVFLALQDQADKATIWEEGEAVKELYDRYLKPHKGFLSSK